ncbi:hypothetical protein K0B96_05180 [Horticoccus luteus]|uniref:Uncharacterized protein n=1 Tax=Horticoccus luteus TaxID=2862869 RepID=A0A8F9TYC9_9BACT|nr:hypothetical protein [Horticoccus luteus]QYM80013.1 hypothetical protein K0B96_05180 [Horticoccus luteus]
MKPLEPSTSALVIAALLAAGSLGWSAWSLHRLQPRPIAPLTASAGETPPVAEAKPDDEKVAMWAPPPAQSHGGAWVYDVFSPPEIFYDAATKQFTVTPPVLHRPSAGLGGLAGLELAGVARELYRFQLVGFIGREGDWRGTFEDRLTGETFLGQEGRALAQTGLTVRLLEVRRVQVDLPDSMSTTQRVATAVLHDDRTGEETELNSAAPRYTESLVASVITADGAHHDLRRGDDLPVGEEIFHVAAVRLDPPAIELVADAAADGRAPEHHTLALKSAPPVPTASSSTSVTP